MGPGRPGIPNKRDRIQGKGKIFCGFVFVEMPNKDEADKAIAGLNGVDLKGRPLTANEARPRTDGGGGRDGFGDG